MTNALRAIVFCFAATIAAIAGGAARADIDLLSNDRLNEAVRSNDFKSAESILARNGATDRIETGKGAQLIFVVGFDAFLLRENSRLELSGASGIVNVMRLATGALLSVFGSGAKRVVTTTSASGIRGTGIYVESEPERSYVCTCYGDVLISAVDDANVSERIVSKHHDAPRYVLKAGANRIQPAPFINHTDVELALIEALVGRTPPFSLFDVDYGGARRY